MMLIKKTRKTPDSELQLARKRLKEVKKTCLNIQSVMLEKCLKNGITR